MVRTSKAEGRTRMILRRKTEAWATVGVTRSVRSKKKKSLLRSLCKWVNSLSVRNRSAMRAKRQTTRREQPTWYS